MLAQMKDLFSAFGEQLLFAFLVIILGYLVARCVRYFVAKLLQRRYKTYSDRSVQRRIDLFSHLSFLATLLLIIIVILNILGVPISVWSSLVSFGIALGLIGDVAWGLQIFTTNPFTVGDVIELGEDNIRGMVQTMSIGRTEIITPDHRRIIIANKRLFEKYLIIDEHPGRKILLQLSVGPDAGLKQLERFLDGFLGLGIRAVEQMTYDVSAIVASEKEMSIHLVYRAPTRNFFEFVDELKGRLVEEGITINHIQVHLG